MKTSSLKFSNQYYLELTDGVKNSDGSWAKQPTLKKITKQEWKTLEKQLKELAKYSEGREEKDVDKITIDHTLSLTELHDFLDIDKGDGFRASDLANLLPEDFEAVNKTLKKQGVYLKNLLDGYDQERSKVLSTAKKNGWAAEFFDPKHQRDREVENNAVQKSRASKGAVVYFHEPSKENLLQSLEEGYEAFETVLKNLNNSEQYKKQLLDPSFLLETNTLHPKLIGALKDENQIDIQLYTQLASQSVREEGDTLELLRSSLQTDSKFIIASALTYAKAAEKISPSQQKDFNFAMEMVETNGATLRYFPRFQGNEEIVKTAGTKGFFYADKKLQRKPEFYEPAIEERGSFITLVPDRQITKRLVLKALRAQAILTEIPVRFRKDREVILARLRYKNCFFVEEDGNQTKNKDFKIIQKAFDQWGKKEKISFYADAILANHREAMEWIPKDLRNKSFHAAIEKLKSQWDLSLPAELLDSKADDQYGQFIASLSKININYPEQIRSLRYLAYVLQDALHPRPSHEPISGRINLFRGVYDYNHAFIMVPAIDWLLEDLEKLHPVKPGLCFPIELNYKEFKTPQEWINAHDPEKPADYGMEMGHGNKGVSFVLSLGEPTIEKTVEKLEVKEGKKEIIHIDLFKNPEVVQRIRASYKIGAYVHLDNCSSGRGREYNQNNLVNTFSSIIRDGIVFGPDQDSVTLGLSVKANGALSTIVDTPNLPQPPTTIYIRDTRFSLQEAQLILMAKQHDPKAISELRQLIVQTSRGKEILKFLIRELEDPQKRRKTVTLLGELSKHPLLSQIISEAILALPKNRKAL